MGQGLADVVQKRAARHDLRIHAHLSGHHARDVRGLHQVAQHVLTVRGAVFEPADQIDQLGVEVGDPDVEHGVLGRAPTQCRHLFAGPLERLLDPMRVDAPVIDQRLQGDPADLATNRIEAREQDCLRSVVDDDVDSGDRLEGPDVPALPADDPALDLVGRQVNDRYHALGRLVGRHPLDGLGHDLSRPNRRSRRSLVLQPPNHESRITPDRLLLGSKQFGSSSRHGQPGDAAEFSLLYLQLLVDLGDTRS